MRNLQVGQNHHNIDVGCIMEEEESGILNCEHMIIATETSIHSMLRVCVYIQMDRGHPCRVSNRSHHSANPHP
jgi:hypothetical protein